jgi:hypothetical protein
VHILRKPVLFTFLSGVSIHLSQGRSVAARLQGQGTDPPPLSRLHWVERPGAWRRDRVSCAVDTGRRCVTHLLRRDGARS